MKRAGRRPGSRPTLLCCSDSYFSGAGLLLSRGGEKRNRNLLDGSA